MKTFYKLQKDAFRAGKVLASNPRSNHAAALFERRGENYRFKDSTEGLIFLKFLKK